MKFVDLDGVANVVRHYDKFRVLISKGRPSLVVVRGQGGLEVHLQEGVASMDFPSRDVLKTALANWRSLYGLRLVVGNASGVRLLHNDRLIDLAPFTQVNVARLTLE